VIRCRRTLFAAKTLDSEGNLPFFRASAAAPAPSLGNSIETCFSLAPFYIPRQRLKYQIILLRVHVDLPELIRGVNRRLEQMLEAELKPRSMSLHQYRVLKALTEGNGLPMGDLATRLFVDGPTLTKIIDRMVESAEVYRGPDPHDRRKVLIFLSRRGAAQFKDIGPLIKSIQQDVLDRLGTSDAAALTSLLLELLGDRVAAHPYPVRGRETLNHG
jgi:DNA-binding MarR family transcriptional regulator